MRVVHITILKQSTATTSGASDGLGRFLEEIVAAQKDLGLETDILRVPIAALNEVSGAVARRDWKNVAKIGCAILGTLEADVVHVHDWYGAVVLEHLYRCGHRALVMTSHLPLRRGFTYRDTGLDWQAKSILEDRALRAVMCLTAPSEYVAQFLVEEYGFSRHRITVVPHGVDCKLFRPLGEYELRGPIRLLAVGRLTEQKGFELLIRALPLILATEPTTHLTIIGNGGRRESLERLIMKLGLGGVVTLLDIKATSELRHYFDRATLLIIPSQFEPFGLVGLEAMACGCPVMAIAPTGASEYLEPPELTAAYSPARFGAAIVGYLQTLRACAGVRSSVRSRAKAWTWQKAAAAYNRIYTELVP